MPLINITLLEGRDNALVQKFMKNIALTTKETLNVPEESIRVIVNEVPKNRFSVGTKLKSEN